MRYELSIEPEHFEYNKFEDGTAFFRREASIKWSGEINRSSSDYVRWIQSSLNNILGLNSAVDGIIGPQTRSAIRSFQQKNGLVVDGIVGPKTEAALISAGALPPPGHVTGGATPVAPCLLRWVQMALNAALGLNLTVDGVLGLQTRSALRSFQEQKGLTVSGSPDPMTIKHLTLAAGGPSASLSCKPVEIVDRFRKSTDEPEKGAQNDHTRIIGKVALCISKSQRTSNPLRSLTVVGHASIEGEPGFNQRLGTLRAKRVARVLADALRHMVNNPVYVDETPGRNGMAIVITTSSRGATQPTENGPERDRRVEIHLPIAVIPPPPPTDTRLQTWEQVLSGGRHGNRVTSLIRGADTFKAMADAIKTANTSAHFIYLIAWWLSDDILLDPADPHSSIRGLFMDKSRKGVQIRAMLWDQGGSHNTVEKDRINNLPTGASILDNNTLSLGSHHQKILIVKGEQGLIAFCGGVDINPDRVRRIPPSGFGQFACPVSGTASPLHDVHCKIEGPSAFDLLNIFIRRWVAHPDHQALDSVKGPLLGICEPVPPNKGQQYIKIACTFNWVIPRPLPLPAQRKCIQDRSLRDTMIAVIRRARKEIYLEDQYLVSMQAARELHNALNFIQRLIIVIGHSSISDMPQVWRRRKDFIDHLLTSPHASKVQVYYRRATPTAFGPYDYVHSKTWIIDEEVAIIGSANCNRRGWSHDSEVIAAIYDPDFAKALKRRLLLLHTPVWVPYNQNESTDTRHCDNAPWDSTVDPNEGERLTHRCLHQPPLPVCPQSNAPRQSIRRRRLASYKKEVPFYSV